MKETIAVIGGGAWGTALANLAGEGGRNVEIYIREQDAVDSINTENENSHFLKGVKLNPTVRAKSMDELDHCSAQHFIWTVPTQFSRSTAKRYKNTLNGKNILNASKGIEIDTGKLLNDIMSEELDVEFSALSGPTFAIEVAKKYPSAVSIASANPASYEWWQKELACSYFRAYTTKDVEGVLLGGAIKNVIALAAGISDGLDLGYNSRAAVITRGLAEMTRLGVAYKAERETFLGLAGIGDLVLTCTADNSRNRSTGLLIAAGETYESIAKKTNTVAEGVFTAKAVYIAAQKLSIEMPITEEVYKIVYEHKSPAQSFKDLMNRPVTRKESE